MIKNSDMGPRLTVPISDDEKQLAKQAKDEFKVVLKELKDAIDVVLDLRDAILEQRPSKEELKNKYKGRLLRYKKRITDTFNIFLNHLKNNLSIIAKINDPDISRLREILISEISELSDGVEALLDLLEDADKENFTQTLEQLCSQLEKREVSISDAIGNQLFGKLDHDILGKFRVSEFKFNIKKRSRLLLFYMR